MLEREIGITSDGLSLSATACLPSAAGRHPAVLMIHGSGPLDRDGNVRGQRLDLFNTLARRLAADGLASLRFDKRGCGRSTGDFRAAGHLDHVADARSCLQALRGADFADPDRLFALGHSEGSLIAARLGAAPNGLAGIVALSPFVAPVDALLMAQARHLDAARRRLGPLRAAVVRVALGDPVATQRRLLERVRTSDAPSLRCRLRSVNARWLRELMAADPEALFAVVACPVLVIGGGKDVQCDPADVDRIVSAAGPAVEAHLLPGLTHVLRSEPGARVPTVFDYPGLLSRPVEAEVLDLVAGWLSRIAAAGR